MVALARRFIGLLGVAVIGASACAEGEEIGDEPALDGAAGVAGGGAGGGAGKGGTSGAGGADASSSGGSAGGGGAAGSDGGACSTAADCPAPASECVLVECTQAKCSSSNLPPGTPTSTQTPGDCKEQICDGSGKPMLANNDADLPADGNPCTNDVCTNGVVSNPPTAAGTTCGASLTCDGKGACTGCSVASDCPGQDTTCAKRTCVAGTCGFSNSASGTACTEGGGKLCNGSGQCVACLAATDCSGTDTECAKRTCTSNVCGTSYTASGTPTAAQTAGDCQKNVCNGAGSIVATADATDAPSDGKQCTEDQCSGTFPSHPPKPAGSACTEGGGKVCNGSGTCVGCLTAADCGGNPCQNNQCVTQPTCNPGTVDCDGQSGNGCECVATACCGSQCPPPHINGLGQSFFDCSPSGVPGNAATYSVALAMAARAAWPVSGTDGNCSCVPGAAGCVYRQTATSCAVWVYEKGTAGHVQLNTSSNQCACPAAGGLVWY